MSSEGEILSSPVSSRLARKRRPSRLQFVDHDAALEQAVSFLDSIKDEVSPTAPATSIPLQQNQRKDAYEETEERMITSSPTPMDRDDEVRTATDSSHRRRESQIWEGDFNARASKKSKRFSPGHEQDDDRPLHSSRLSPGEVLFRQGTSSASIVKILFDLDSEAMDATKRWVQPNAGLEYVIVLSL